MHAFGFAVPAFGGYSDNVATCNLRPLAHARLPLRDRLKRHDRALVHPNREHRLIRHHPHKADRASRRGAQLLPRS